MKYTHLAITGIALSIVAYVAFMAHDSRVSAAPAPAATICRPDTQTFAHTFTAYPADTGLAARQTSALNWLQSMLEPYRPAGDGSTISADAPYANGYAGTMTGTFTLAPGALYAPSIGDPTVYEGLEMRYYLRTDGDYHQGSNSPRPVRTDGTWTFNADGDPGEKVVQLIDITNPGTPVILAEYFQPPDYGLIRSYEYLPGQVGYNSVSARFRSYTYDQALALMVAIGSSNKPMADRLLGGLANIQVASGPAVGAFPSSARQYDPASTDTSYWTGGNAIALYAITRYIEAYGDTNGAGDMLRDGLAFIDTMRSTTGPAEGLYQGGTSLSGVTWTPTTWHSTEHNVDTWHLLERAGRVLDDASLRAKAQELADTIVAKLWNTGNNRFNQGFNDTDRALDTASWGSIFLNAVGEYDKAVQSAANTTAYAYTSGGATGFTPYLDNPSSVPTVWYEGTYGVALAHHVFGDQPAFAQVVADSLPGQQGNGAFPYAEDADIPNGRTDANSVASTAWFLLSTDYPSAIWSECFATASSRDSDAGAAEATPGNDELLAATGQAPPALLALASLAAAALLFIISRKLT